MFAINPHTLPSVSSYQEAVALFERLPEAKNRTPDEKLLKGVTRDHDKRIRYSGGAVSFIYHRTPLVQWHSSDRITIVHHDSVSSRLFIDRFLPGGMWVRSHRGATVINNCAAKKGLSDWYYRDGRWQPELNDIQVQYKMRLNRKKANEIKNRVMPFIEWRDGLNALQNKQPLGYRLPSQFMLQRLLDQEPGCRDFYAQFREEIRVESEKLLRMLYVVGGAVERVPLPLGELPPKSQWDDLQRLMPSEDV